jgi:putative FmdB family regulatory protein
MPIYEYTCMNCSKDFDALRSMKDADAPIECEHCQSERTIRKVSVFYASSAGRVVAGGSSSSACGSCSGGSCATCR